MLVCLSVPVIPIPQVEIGSEKVSHMHKNTQRARDWSKTVSNFSVCGPLSNIASDLKSQAET